MSGNSIRKRELQRKVLCSLLAAGVMSVCISGGDVWAAAGDLAAQGVDKTYIANEAGDSVKIIGGWDFYKGQVDDGDHAAVNTKVTLSSGKFDELIGGSHIKQPGTDTYIVGIGDTNVTMQGGEVSYVVGGTKANNSDNTTLKTGSTNIIISGGSISEAVIGGSYIKATGNQGGGTPAATTATTGNTNLVISGGTINGNIYGGSVAENYGTQQQEGKPNLQVTDANTNIIISNGNITGDVYAGGAAIGANSVSNVSGTSAVKVSGGNINGDIYAGGLAVDGGKNTVTKAEIKISDADINGSILGLGKTEGKNSSADISGTTTIDLENTNIKGLIYLDNDKQKLSAKNLTVTDVDVAGGSTRYKGVSLNGGAEAVFSGEKTEIIINSDIDTAEVAGIQLFNGAKATFSAQQTTIDVSSIGKSGCWGFGLLLNGTGNTAVFDGGDVTIKNYQEKYTSQTVTAKADSSIEFNNTGNVVISAKSPFGVTTVDNQGNIIFNNQGNVDISAEIVPGNQTGQTNVVGIQSGTGGSKTIVTDKVENFNITLTGAGVDNDGSSYSTGTYGIVLDKNIDAEINAKNFNINISIAEDVIDDSPDGHTAEKAYGIDPDGGYIKVGKNTVTNINITDGLGTSYAVNTASDTSTVELLGDTTITAAGKNGSYALYAEDGGKITVGSEGKTVNLTGNVVSESNGVVTLAGDTNTVKGIVTADGGSVVLNGGNKATYDVDKFVTTSSGKIIVSGGTLNIDELSNANKFELGKKDNSNNNSLEVTGKGVLQAAAKNIFDATGSSASKVADAVDAKVLFSGGKLAISDASYKLADSKAYSTALAAAESNAAKTTLVMTGTLQQEDIPNNTAGVEDLAPTGAVHTQVTGTVESDTLNIGGAGTGSPDTGTSVNNDLGVKDLDFSGSGSTVESAKVNISNDTGLTLVGDGSGDLLKGTNSSGNKVTVGSTDYSGQGTAGTLTLGNTASVNSGGNLNAAVELGHNDSQMNVEAGSFKVDKITATAGTVAVNEGAALKTAELTIGTATGNNDTEGTVKAAGTVEVDKLTVNKGTVAVTGTLAATTELKASSDTSIAVGDSTSAGTLTATGVQLQGASIVLDPAWRDSSTIATASKAGLEFANSHQIDGKLTVGQNSVLSLGTTDTSKAEEAFAATGLNWGQNDITAALYIDVAQTLDNSNGGIKVDGTLTHDSEAKDLAAANNAEFADQSLLMVSSAAAAATDGALKATNSGKLTVDAGAKLYIADAQADKTYTVVSGFSGTNDSDVKGWTGDNLLLNKLVKATESNFDNGSFTVKTEKVKASEALPGVALPNILDAITSDTNSEYAGVKYLSNAISGLNTDAQTIASVNAFAQGAENSGASHSSVLAAFDTGSIVQGHLSLASKGNEQRGGFGKATADREDNGGIWAQYIHNKDKSDAGYEGQYNGFVLGGDFADKGKYSSGIAFSYGSGDSTGSASKNEYDFWGLSYYGGIRNDDTNLIFDVGYSKNSSEIKGVVNADPDTRIITLGVKGEKMYTNGHGTKFVPYAGLRYMNVDTDSYTGTIDGKNAANYSPDKADLWLLPVGVSITNETVSESGWKVRPTADIAYVWTMGDNDNAMGITVPGINAQDRLGYELMDSGFFVGRLGLEAEKDDWTYGVSYSYQKGSDAQSNKWFVDVKYSF